MGVTSVPRLLGDSKPLTTKQDFLNRCVTATMCFPAAAQHPEGCFFVWCSHAVTWFCTRWQLMPVAGSQATT